MSGGVTSPFEIAKMRAATRGDGPLARNRSLRTDSDEIAPIRSAISESDMASRRIQSFRETMPSGLAPMTAAPAVLPPARLSEVFTVLLSDLIAELEVGDNRRVLEGLANRLYRRGRTTNGSAAAIMLGSIATDLMRLEV